MGILLTAANILFAIQAAQATVAGSVRDEETGEPLAGAVVALPDLDRAAVTDAGGRYVLPEVPSGPQHITVRFIGHAPRALHALVPSDGHLEINVSLRAEPVRLGTIEVRTPLSIRGLDGSDSSVFFFDRGSSIAAVRNNPLLSEPDVLQALDGGPVAMRAESPSGIHIRGGATDQTAYLLDGVPIFSPYHAAGQFGAWNPDALSGVYLSSSVPLPGYPDALGGTISGATRAPGDRFEVQGSLSTTQARVTMDGGIGRSGAGYLVSVRSRVPGLPGGDDDPSYIRAESGDRLAKLEAPAAGGRIRLLAYDSGNEIEAAAEVDASAPQSRRNEFEWGSRSLGAEWSGSISGVGVRFLGWSATGDATSAWAGQAGPAALEAARRDLGLLGTVERRSARTHTAVGIRIERSRTFYAVTSDSAPALWTIRASTPVATAFAQHTRELNRPTDLTLGVSLAAADAGLHLGPHAQLRWRPAARLTLSSSYARTHQFSQSLRNAESVVGNVFPADLYVGATAPGVPTARSDVIGLTADYRPFAGARLAVEAYRRSTDGLLLVAPRDGGPFTTGGFAAGSGRSTGLSVDAALSRARYGLVASYGLQRVRLAYGESGYVPDNGATHLLQGGLIVFPTATASVRLGATGALGRRTTSLSSGFEWEACNLLDRGCEFAGSPHYGDDAIGATALPAYLRIDLGVRKHWHFQLGRRDAMVALFATATNLLNRKNVLTYAEDPSTGERLPIEMRPLAPLVVGLDWRF
jgi:hypothetical protein